MPAPLALGRRPSRPARCARATRSVTVPSKWTRPASSTTTRLHSAATSSVWCVEMTIVDVAAMSASTPRSDARCSGSSPVVGSSRTSSCGVPSRAWARATRRRWPPGEPADPLGRHVAEADEVEYAAHLGGSGTAVGPLLEHGHVVDEGEGGETAGEAELLRLVAQPAPHLGAGVRLASGRGRGAAPRRRRRAAPSP